MGVIRCTPVRDEAQISGKPQRLSSDRTDWRVWERKGILCRGQGGIDTPLILSLENPRFLCRPQATVLQSGPECLCSRRTSSRRPEDLTGKTMAQIGLYTHRAQADRGSSNRPGALTPDTPALGSSHPRGPWIDLRVRHRKLRKSARNRLPACYSSPGLRVCRLSKPLSFTANIRASRLLRD